jgi:hypothetical protein
MVPDPVFAMFYVTESVGRGQAPFFFADVVLILAFSPKNGA